ncbi:hypothetical protein B0H66DRAFT_621255 [Apodospora peruviana]|uniref:Uncharacterized protein n=1 Tax=Apodospora peruviana TaxID=516989 RepID=A0AAE0IE18_9PEZI|nr:hypothetical protein B0H66DRAFT_621255 [Apodospora peruviana]
MSIRNVKQNLLQRAISLLLISLVFSIRPVLAQEDDRDEWDNCKDLVESIINGTTATHDGITKDNISQYIYDGPVRGLDGSYPRADLLLVTYEGCNRLCGSSTVVWNTRPTALNIVATWVFPLSILLGLPFESYHRKKVRRTLAAVSYWLGSPQTSLTAAVWNFRQTRDCHRRVRDASMSRIWADSYYVLSCFNQFELGLEEPKKQLPIFLRTLVYALFRPLASRQQEIKLVTELLSALAFQLRMHRRRGVIPTLASLGTFLLAFIFSLVLAFGDLSDSTTIFVLDLGIFFSWLPVLVILTIVDRNPVSSERQAILMSRWLYNANAIWEWSNPDNIRHNTRSQTTTNDALQITQMDQDNIAKGAMMQVAWWKPSVDDDLGPYQVGEFIGQGRGLQYCGLTSATLKCTEARGSFKNWSRDTPTQYADEIISRLKRRPLSWYMTAIVCLMIIWTEIMLAFTADFITPTVGLGCWSMIFLLYGCFSTITWFLQFWVRPGKTTRTVLTVISHSFNGLSVIWIILIVILLASGVLNNCYCNTVMNGKTGYGGYTDFESFQFYRDHYGLTAPWITAAAIGSSIPIAALVTALSWWQKCKHLWAASESGRELSMENRTTCIDMTWLGE